MKIHQQELPNDKSTQAKGSEATQNLTVTGIIALAGLSLFSFGCQRTTPVISAKSPAGGGAVSDQVAKALHYQEIALKTAPFELKGFVSPNGSGTKFAELSLSGKGYSTDNEGQRDDGQNIGLSFRNVIPITRPHAPRAWQVVGEQSQIGGAMIWDATWVNSVVVSVVSTNAPGDETTVSRYEVKAAVVPSALYPMFYTRDSVKPGVGLDADFAVEIPSENFEDNSSNIRDGGRQEVMELQRLLQSNPQATCLLIGYPDPTTKKEDSVALANMRATVIRSMITADETIDPARIGVISEQEIRPPSPTYFRSGSDSSLFMGWPKTF